MADPWNVVKRAYGNARKLGIAKIALSGEILDCNQAFAEIVGRDTSAAIGSSIITDLTLPEDLDVTRVRFKQMAQGKEPVVSSEKNLLTIGGQTVAVWFEACVINDSAGNPAYIIDALWKVGTLPTEVEKLEAMFDVLKTQIASQPQINITGADMGNRINTGGGDYAGRNNSGRNQTANDQRQVGILIGGFVLMAIAFAWAMYYIATTAGGNPSPVPPNIKNPNIENPVIESSNEQPPQP